MSDPGEAPAATVLPPMPPVTPETAPFWESVKSRALRLQRCGDCGQFFFPPSTVCQNCWSTNLSWEPVKGTGTIFSFVVFRRLYHKAFADVLPYAVCVVELDEGPRLPSRLVGVDDLDAVHVGQRVAFVYDEVAHDVVLPNVTLA